MNRDMLVVDAIRTAIDNAETADEVALLDDQLTDLMGYDKLLDPEDTWAGQDEDGNAY